MLVDENFMHCFVKPVFLNFVTSLGDNLEIGLIKIKIEVSNSIKILHLTLVEAANELPLCFQHNVILLHNFWVLDQGKWGTYPCTRASSQLTKSVYMLYFEVLLYLKSLKIMHKNKLIVQGLICIVQCAMDICYGHLALYIVKFRLHHINVNT